MNLYSLPPFLTALIALYLGFFVLSRKRKSQANNAFFLLCLCTFWWQFSWVILFNIKDGVLAFYLIKIGYSGIIFISITFFHFVTEFLGIRLKKFLITNYLIGLFFLVSLWTSDGFICGFFKFYWGYYPQAGLLHPFHLLQLCIMTSAMLLLLIRYVRVTRPHPIRYNQAKYIILAIGFYFPAVSDYLVNYGVEFYPLGFIFVLSALSIFAYSIAKYNLMGIEVIFKELFAKIISFMFVNSLTFVLLVWGLKLLDVKFQIFSILIGMTTMAFIMPLIARLAVNISQRIRPRPDFQAILKNYAEIDIVTQHTSKGLAELVVKKITDSLKPTVCSLMLLDEETGLYSVIASSGEDEEIKTIAFKKSNHLILSLKDSRHIRLIIKDELDKVFSEGEASLIKRDLDILRSQITLPLVLRDKLCGLLNLGLKRSGELYTPEEIGFVYVFLAQSAFMMEFLDKIQKIHELKVRAEKLAGMTNLLIGFNHEFRNQLNNMQIPIISGVENLVSHEDLEKARLTAQEASAIMTMILDSVEEYHSFCEVSSTIPQNVNISIEEAFSKLKPKFDQIGAQITLELAKDLLEIEAYPTFNNLFFNLFTNCYFALAKRKIRLLNVKTSQTKDSQRPIEIIVTDTGGDMAKMMQKEALSSGGEYFPERSNIGGINFFLARHIIEDHQGELTVFTNLPSTPKEQPGAIFTIKLPRTQPKK